MNKKNYIILIYNNKNYKKNIFKKMIKIKHWFNNLKWSDFNKETI